MNKTIVKEQLLVVLGPQDMTTEVAQTILKIYRVNWVQPVEKGGLQAFTPEQLGLEVVNAQDPTMQIKGTDQCVTDIIFLGDCSPEEESRWFAVQHSIWDLLQLLTILAKCNVEPSQATKRWCELVDSYVYFGSYSPLGANGDEIKALGMLKARSTSGGCRWQEAV